MSKEMVNIKEAAEHIGVNRRTVERWIKAGVIKAYKYNLDNRERLLKLEDLNKLRQVEELK